MPVTFQIVIFAVIAAVLLFQLYNVLGKKVGRQPEDNPKPVPVPAAPAGAPEAARGPVVDPALTAAIAGLKTRDPNFDPHRFLEGARQAYETIVRAYAKGDRDALRPLLTDKVMGSFEAGIAALDGAARGQGHASYVAALWEADRVAVLRAIEKDAFFRTVRAGLVTDLYNQKEVWPLFGYEGESFSHGGYIDRGFNDIAWL